MGRFFNVCCACLFLSMTAQAQFRVTDLRVEHCQNPTVVDAGTPRFSWINQVKNEKLRGQCQTAYQIAVASSAEKLAKGEFDVWDTGKTPSDESSLIEYDGPELKSAADYYWQVRTWNQNDKVSLWSETAQWGMGLRQEEWTSHWISAQKEGKREILVTVPVGSTATVYLPASDTLKEGGKGPAEGAGSHAEGTAEG